MKEETCFGAIAIRKEKNQWQLFLVCHTKGKYWGFPKGHAEGKEEPFATACRELKEETNLDVVKRWPFSYTEAYTFIREHTKIHKTVVYFLVEAIGNISLQKEEIIEAKWIDLDHAFKLLSFAESQKIILDIAKILKNA